MDGCRRHAAAFPCGSSMRPKRIAPAEPTRRSGGHRPPLQRRHHRCDGGTITVMVSGKVSGRDNIMKLVRLSLWMGLHSSGSTIAATACCEYSKKGDQTHVYRDC